MTRVLHIITRLDRGGSEQRLRDVLQTVPGHHDVVIGRASDPNEVARIADDAEVSWNQSLLREVDPVADARAFRQLVAQAREGRYDVVHTHQAKSSMLGRAAAAAARIPIVYHSASMASFGPGYGTWESRGFALAERVTAPMVRRFFVVGRDLKERLRRVGVAERRLDIVRSSLDLAPFTPPDPDGRRSARQAFGLDPDAPVLCYVGSLDPRKGVTLLPDLARQLRERVDPGATLLVAGEGPLRDELAAGFAAHGSGARLLGYIPNVAELMQAADAIVLPSSAEGVPQVLVQAMACGLPFAAYDVDGVAELNALGAVGKRIRLGDARGLIEACAEMLVRDEPRTTPPAPTLAQWGLDEIGRRYRAAYARDIASARRVP
jgi:glycosyltransferase involved in cell wall biosynthesis